MTVYNGPIHDGPIDARRGVAAAKAGIGFGSALAITISWSLHHSIVWAIIHGFFSWLYVAYYALKR
jgi:hypothetical protein